MKADFFGILLFLDSIVYNLVDFVYDIFNALVKTNIFSDTSYTSIVSRIYVALGMIMLFALAYSLLKAIINPENFSKGETSFPKLIQNVVISLIIIAVLPTVFNFAFKFQESVLTNDTIPKLLFGDGQDYTQVTESSAGRQMAYNVWTSFLHPNTEWCSSEGYSITTDANGNSVSDLNLSACASNIKADGHLLFTDGEPLDSVTTKFKNNEYSLYAFQQFGEAVDEGWLTYNWLISTIAGAFLLIVLVNFCFDMAVRVVKLMFFQIIAPIPVICRVIPSGSLKDVFSTWTKKTVSTFLDAFIRVFIMYLGVYMVQLVVNNFDYTSFGGLSVPQALIARTLIILGIVTFIRQAPKLIADMFHLDSGGMKLGIMDKLAAGGALAAGSALGGGAGMLVKNGAAAVQGVRKAEKGKKLGAAVGGLASTVSGTLSGASRGLYGARNAKNFGDMKKSASAAIATAVANKASRENYRASHKGVNAIDTMFNVGMGHISDNIIKASQWVGLDDGLSVLQAEKNSYKKFLDNESETDSTTVDLIGRAAIAQSAKIMNAASGVNMSYDAMKEVLGYERNMSAESMMGKTLYDFKNGEHVIESVNDYANYLSIKKAQLDKAERDLKKYIKRFAYQDDSVNKITRDAAANDVISSIEGINNSKALMRAAANINMSSNEMSERISNLSTVNWDSSMAGSVETDFMGNSITLNNAEDFKQYIGNLKEQAAEANTRYRNYIANLALSNKVDVLNSVLNNEGIVSKYKGFKQDFEFGSGELQRMNKIHSYSDDVRNLIIENPTILDKLNSMVSEDKKVTDINGPDAWDKMDQLINNIKDRNININAEINKLLREKEAKSGDSSKK